MAAAGPQAVSAPPSAAAPNPGKRKRSAKGKGGKSKKNKLARSDEPIRRRANKPSAKFLKLLKKRARDYNSDDDEEEGEEGEQQQKRERERPHRRRNDDHDDEEEGDLSEDDEDEAASSSGDEAGGGGGGVTRFEEGCRAFRVAFQKIMSKKLPDDPLGPILSAHKKLVAAKLAEEVEERKPKGEARKEKRAAAEKGHVLPKEHLETHDKELIKIATQGVVRLFNAVSKAQKPRNDLNPSSTRDAKGILCSSFLCYFWISRYRVAKIEASKSDASHYKAVIHYINLLLHIMHAGKDEDEPGWAPLRDTYMLGSKLKDWDKMKDTAVESEQTKAPLGDSSDEE
ncbi:hypothetical protein PR202_gb11984 [Eleusine coracana subsp. coracana]|uniref:Uncharacterized protein n=1 Tax=Eleusine coracana subsp. coracana TaxID=191504 RepID=A0AAV5ELM6_ELECO|nr:hypothetical protein PR202_gb11984 [Eleusine coracana subsp. coracana]